MAATTTTSGRDRTAVVTISPRAFGAPATARVPEDATPRGLPHYPALDGLRGLAVAGVILFHSGYSWARGGFLGVSTFFTLSGFLITGLLLAERRATGAIDLRRFWARRMRRLLPALFAAVAVAALFGALLSDADQLVRVRNDGLAALAYVANWRFVLSGQSYGDLFAAPSPLLHTWSLAIEEQFYLVFPLLVAVVTWRRKRPLVVLAAVLGGLTAASVAASVMVGGGADRVYYGTDTRAAELLVGALVAVGLARWDSSRLTPRWRWTVAVGGAAALGATLMAWALVAHESAWLYRGGFGAHALLTAAVLLAAIVPGPVRALLSSRPLRGLGTISYGLYLYHWPVFLWLSPARTGLDGGSLLAARMGLTVAAALASYHLLEMPIRRGRITRGRAYLVAPVAVAGLVVVLLWVSVAPPPPSPLAAARPVAAETPVNASTEAVLDLRPATAARPLRVLVTGDSVGYDAQPAIRAALAGSGAAVVHGGAMVGFGITETSGWRARWKEMLHDSRAEVVALMFGTWDGRFIAEHGRQAYDRRLDEAIALFDDSGAKVVVIGMSASVTREGDPLQRPADASFRALPDRWPGVVVYIDADPVLSPGGVFTEHLAGPDGTSERVRKLDGTHLCPAGAARVADAVATLLSDGGAIPRPEGTWRAGDWALDARYNDPPGACPRT